MGFHALANSKSFFTSETHLPYLPSFSSDRRRPTPTPLTRTLHLNQRPNSLRVFATQEEPPKLNSQDLMELKFGRLLGEDPKLTLAKIMGRKANPDATFLDIEKSYYKKGKHVEVEEVPFEGSKERKSSSKLDGLGLVRPVPAKGASFQSSDNKVPLEIKKPSQQQSNAGNVNKSILKRPLQSNAGSLNVSSAPNVILRKPTVYKEDDEDVLSRLRVRPNLYQHMRDGQVKEKFSDMSLLRKPEPPIAKDEDTNQESSTCADNKNDLKISVEDSRGKAGNWTLLEQPHRPESNNDEQSADSNVMLKNDELEQHYEFQQELSDSSQLSNLNSVDKVDLSEQVPLQGKPQRLDQHVKQTSDVVEENAFMNTGGYKNNDELGNLVDVSDFQEGEDADWTRAEDLIRNGDRADVEILSCSSKGFIVSFGSLVGFLPYRNLVSKWKFLAFESWLRKKGLDPSMYKQSLDTITSYDAEKNKVSPNSPLYQENDTNVEEKFSPDMKMEDLLRIYDQEKIEFLSSFIGQKVRANLLSVERKSRKLIFSLKPKENEDLLEKKRNLMARLQVGDIVKCCIQKITYFGIFVELEGEFALIHQSELSWDATLNPASYFKIGQVIEAKVLQLDFALGRISLSLKGVTPDPLMDSLESVVGEHGHLDGRLEEAQTDEEWPEVESLIKELQKIEGIESVSKGRFFRSPGLAPTFQVYMASIFDNQYKLLARSGNKIQEVIVETCIDKERMKSVIMTCTNRVE
ncbi:uncharacterized protein LOC130969276 [Arachis stenosperma]|uniref:uncharacterized protein LOC130969276 n=1 Tax=Arachis stenosperma TaxID=217475 RepID=UPI0025ACD4B7|nr:uncharacterized protein LOC130969276 [Arachis stenosperma]